LLRALLALAHHRRRASEYPDTRATKQAGTWSTLLRRVVSQTQCGARLLPGPPVQVPQILGPAGANTGEKPWEGADGAEETLRTVPFNRPCIGSGGACPTRALTKHQSGRCEHCQRVADRQRGTTAERGYGAHHRGLREAWRPMVEAGGITCWRCQQLIDPSDDWDLGHDDLDRSQHRGPEHQLCNRATTNRKQR
jgi:hypothetical protein